MKHALLTASLLLALTGRASAQPGVTPPVSAPDVADEPPARAPLPAPAPAPVMVPEPDAEVAPAPTPTPAPQPSGSRLSEGTALVLSLGGTAVSWGLLFGGAELPGLVGAVLAPSFGNWYAGRYLTRGLGLRVGGMAMFVAGAVVALGGSGGYGHDNTSSDDSDESAGVAILIGGLALFAIGTVDDIISAPANARKTNRERGYTLGLAPVVTQHSAGFALGGRF